MLTTKQINYLSTCDILGIRVMRIEFDPAKSDHLMVTHCDPLDNLYFVEIDKDGRIVAGIN